MHSKQCRGVTTKGARCLIKVQNGEFCHYHEPNRSPDKTRFVEGGQNNESGSKEFQNKYKSLPTKPKESHNKSKSLPKRPRNADLHIPGSFENAITSSSSDRSQDPSWFRTSSSRSPKKYNDMDKRSGYATKTSPKWQPVDNATASPQRYRNSSKLKGDTSPGYIYVYTLSSFLSKHSEGGWIQTRNLSQDKKDKDKWLDVDMRRSQKILVKVGMTTKTPAIRISQWETQCNHKLQCLYPGLESVSGKSSLSRMFGDLSLSEKRRSGKFSTYVGDQHGFYVQQNVLQCEQQIHSLLKSKFGRGEIHCKGCHQNSQDEGVKRSFLNLFRSKEEPQSKRDYNIHNEWFPVPRKNLNDVFSIINDECKKHAM